MSALQYLKTGALLATIAHVTGYTVSVKQGDDAVLSLPRIELCGQYTLLDPLLRPVVVLESGSVANPIESYANRVKIEPTSDGFRFMLRNLTLQDAGKYKLATSSLTTLECINQSYDISVSGESFTTWSSWSDCSVECSPKIRRTRTRKCTVVGGCVALGNTQETQSCAKGDNCGHWSAWGQWGQCSAKCGKGFQVRKRACVSESAVLVKSSLCPGHPTHSQMCLTVCEASCATCLSVVGTWSTWGEWSACSTSCGVGTRLRTRNCSSETMSRDVTLNCTRGNTTEKESCVSTCKANVGRKNFTNRNTSALPFGMTSEVMTSEQTSPALVTEIVQNVTTIMPDDAGWRDDKLTVAMTAAGVACGVTVLAVVVVVGVLKCCRKGELRRPSLPTIRPANEATKRRQNTKNKSPVTGDTIDGNVYSEFNSGWPSNEFDSTYALDNGEFDKKDADETRNPANENVEAGDNLRYEENAIVDAKRIRALGSANPAIFVRVKAPDESEAIGRTRYNIEIFGSNESSAPAVCERSETTYATYRVSFQKYSEDSSIGDKSRNNSLEADNLDPGGQESMAKLEETDDDEEVVENVFYEPPELWSVHDVKHADKMASLRRESETMFREELQDSARSYKFSGSTGLYYEPPEEDQDTSANDRGNGVADEEHIYEDDESLYRNCETANSGGWLSFDHDSALAWNRGKQLSTQCNIDNKYERKGGKANLNEFVHESNDHEEESISNVNIHPDPEEHIYENGMLMAKTLYEAPKNNFGRNNAANGRGSIDKERIYDVPNFNNP